MIVLRVMENARFGKALDELIEALKNYPLACDEVWLPGNYGYPPMEVHVKNGQDLIPIAERFRALGIRPSLQISNTLGHGSTRDTGGMTDSFRLMVGPDGRSGAACFFPACPNFLSYVYDMARAYCVFRPDSVWVDDDLRAEWHYPDAEYGCFCPDCVSKFNKKYGYDLTREEIVARMAADPAFREQYVSMNREDIANVMRTVCRAVRSVSPESHVGWEYVAVSGYGGPDYNYVFEAMRDELGEAPLSRPGHGVYSDYMPRQLLDKSLLVNYMNEIAPDWVRLRRPEIENCPHTGGGKSLGGTCVEASLELAYGCNGLSFATLQGCCEPTSYHERMWRRFTAHRPYWQKLIDQNDGSTGLGGVSIFFGENMSGQVVDHGTGDPFEWAKVPVAAGRQLAETGLPLSYDRKTCAVRLLHPDMVDYLSDADIRRALHMQVMTDARVIEKLIARGYGEYLPLTVSPTQGGRADVLKSHPANRELAGKEVRLDTSYAQPYCYVLHTEPSCEILGEYVCPDGSREAATAICRTGFGGRWCVFGPYLWRQNTNGVRLTQLAYMADELSGGKLPAYLRCLEEMCVIPRVRRDDGKTVSVTLQNLQIGPTDRILLALRNPAGRKFVWSRPGEEDVEVCAMERNGEYTFDLPPLAAYGTGTLFVR